MRRSIVRRLNTAALVTCLLLASLWNNQRLRGGADEVHSETTDDATSSSSLRGESQRQPQSRAPPTEEDADLLVSPPPQFDSMEQALMDNPPHSPVTPSTGAPPPPITITRTPSGSGSTSLSNSRSRAPPPPSPAASKSAAAKVTPSASAAASELPVALPARATGRPRILLALNGFVWNGNPMHSKWQMLLLDEYVHRYACCDVDIRIDTNDNVTIAVVNAAFPPASLPASVRLAVHITTHEQMWRNDFKLSWIHRQYMHLGRDPLFPERPLARPYDFYWYSEDDMLLPYNHFLLYLQRYRTLWDCCGLLYQFHRTEKHSSGAIIANDFVAPEDSPDLYADAAGHPYARVGAPYQAMWILDADQLAAFVSDPSCIYATGLQDHPAGYGDRESMAIGYAWLRGVEGRGYELRQVAPLLEVAGRGLQLDPRGAVNHTADRFVRSGHPLHSRGEFGTFPESDLFVWPPGAATKPGPLPNVTALQASFPVLRGAGGFPRLAPGCAVPPLGS